MHKNAPLRKDSGVFFDYVPALKYYFKKYKLIPQAYSKVIIAQRFSDFRSNLFKHKNRQIRVMIVILHVKTAC